ncbi:conserved membrane hypothetical protein [Flavobacterium sp. 9R]|uniref:hypothetical protein n=1 Tax=Flavobacterium sp. 9R TaxID=2653143 RepID=UPI0012EFE7D4|nr:hypothetical protein [Flavobacterium sp. 9R]VXB16499.1 conserved membrane hypothetical protein [Flavobacterium sp. 9R]
MTLKLQILWSILCVAWNGLGLYRISQGERPIGPTASLAVAIMTAVFAFLFWFFYNQKLKIPYLLLSGLAALMAAYAVYGAFSQDPSLWPSELWRWAGVVLNGMGFLAGIKALMSGVNWNAKS